LEGGAEGRGGRREQQGERSCEAECFLNQGRTKKSLAPVAIAPSGYVPPKRADKMEEEAKERSVGREEGGKRRVSPLQEVPTLYTFQRSQS